MQTSKKSVVLLAVFALTTSCVSSSPRQPASATDQTTLSGTRVNPVRYSLAPKWKVKLHHGEKNNWKVGKLNLVTYELGTQQGFQAFESRLEALREINKRAAANDKKGKDLFSKGGLIALDEMTNLVGLIKSRQLSERDTLDAYAHIGELASAFSLEFKYPVPPKLWIVAAPFKFLDEYANKPMDKAAGPAVNLIPSNEKDLSKVDPADSSFWKNPGNIRSRNLYYGFGRTELPQFNQPCTYDGPKKSYGVNAGIEVVCQGKKWKFKFSNISRPDSGNEVNSEPFNSRIVNLMGYNAIPIDYVDRAVIEYDRKLLTEFNSRKELATEISSIFGFNYAKLKLQVNYDPFAEAVREAILTDGSTISGKQLRAQLLKSQVPDSEKDDANYNTDFEKKIKYIVLTKVSAEPKTDETEKNIGSWNWNDLDHPDRRELRGYSMLAAFLNSFDVRADNTKVRLVKYANGTKGLRHYISDLGSGLGMGKNLLNHQNGKPNLFPWKVIAAIYEKPDSVLEQMYGDNRERVVSRYRILDYAVIEGNEPFNRAQVEDARWLVRRLAQVSEAQFADALIASGWSAAETKLLLEKLIARRDNLVKELGLANEFALMRPQGVNHQFNYDPRTERVHFVSSNPHITPPINGQRIVNGQVVGQ